jgi:STE24 endopeptidase
VDFKLDNIFVMDGSKRSGKANAFFSGLGKSKKIVLYDTLIEKHSIPELVAVLAHEVGHYKKKHSLKTLIISLAQITIMLYLLGWMLGTLCYLWLWG